MLVGYLGPLEPALNSAALVIGGKAVAGSLIGGIAATQEMLDFCGEHGITSDIEMIDIQNINQVFTNGCRRATSSTRFVDRTWLYPRRRYEQQQHFAAQAAASGDRRAGRGACHTAAFLARFGGRSSARC